MGPTGLQASMPDIIENGRTYDASIIKFVPNPRSIILALELQRQPAEINTPIFITGHPHGTSLKYVDGTANKKWDGKDAGTIRSLPNPQLSAD